MLVSHIYHIYGFLPQPSWTPLPCQYTKTVLKNMKGFEWDLGQGLCGRLKQSREKWCPTQTPCHVEGQPHLTMSTSTVHLARRRKGSVWIYSPSAVPPLACWDLHGRFMISWPWLTSKTGNCSRSFPLVLDISFQDFSTLVTLDLGGVFLRNPRKKENMMFGDQWQAQRICMIFLVEPDGKMNRGMIDQVLPGGI